MLLVEARLIRFDLPDEPNIGDEHLGGANFSAPTRPNPNLAPPRLPTDREVLEIEIRGLDAKLDTIIAILSPGPP